MFTQISTYQTKVSSVSKREQLCLLFSVSLQLLEGILYDYVDQKAQIMNCD